MEQDVFLEHIVTTEGFGAGVENVDPAKCGEVEKLAAEIPEIRAVAEAARRDGCQFAAIAELAQSEPDEGGVKVGGFDADGCQQRALARAGGDFAVGRIKDGVGERQRVAIFEKPVIKRVNGTFDVAGVMDVPCVADADGMKCGGAGFKVDVEGGNECLIRFPDIHVKFLEQGKRPCRPQGGDPIHDGGRKHAAARPGIKQVQDGLVETLFAEPSGQVAGDGRGSEELSRLTPLLARLLRASTPACQIGLGKCLGCGGRNHAII